nr:MAG TPA: Repressor protein CI [Caudoviricetes sp.]
MSTLKERLEELMDDYNLVTQQQLAEFADVSKGLVGQWFNGSTGLGKKPLLAFQKKTNYSTQWLIDGTGEKYQPNKDIEDLPVMRRNDTIRIERIDMAGACGSGAVASDWPSLINSIEFPADAVRRLFAGRDTRGLRLVDTFGDSMEPTIPELSAILIDTRTDSFAGDGIYFFAYAGELYTKRLQKTPSGLIALSDNPLYQPFTIDEDDRFRIIGKYYGVISLKLAIA